MKCIINTILILLYLIFSIALKDAYFLLLAVLYIISLIYIEVYNIYSIRYKYYMSINLLKYNSNLINITTRFKFIEVVSIFIKDLLIMLIINTILYSLLKYSIIFTIMSIIYLIINFILHLNLAKLNKKIKEIKEISK